MKDLTLEQCFELVEMVTKETDGHFTIMRFTTGWKAMFKTPDLDTGNGRKEVSSIKMCETIGDAILSAMHTHAIRSDS